MPTARLCVVARGGARHLALAGFFSSGFYAVSGIIEGRSFAATFTRVNSLGGLDRIEWTICIAYASYIDVNASRAIEAEAEGVFSLVDAAQQLYVTVAGGIGASVAMDKGL